MRLVRYASSLFPAHQPDSTVLILSFVCALPTDGSVLDEKACSPGTRPAGCSGYIDRNPGPEEPHSI